MRDDGAYAIFAGILLLAILAFGGWGLINLYHNLEEYSKELSKTHCADVQITTPDGKPAVERQCWKEDAGLK